MVANSRFLLLPSIAVANLGSHVLALAARRVVVDWRRRYGYALVLLETFVDERCFAGTVYKAANWQRLGTSAGRGRQDRDNRADPGAKGIYALPSPRNWRSVLCQRPAPVRHLPPPTAEPLGSRRNSGAWISPTRACAQRLLGLTQAFFEQPTASTPMALPGDAGQSKAAYRFFNNPQVDRQALLHPHYEATAGRIREHPLVLVAQDTTRLNYDAHANTHGLGRSIPAPTGRRGSSGTTLLPSRHRACPWG